MAGINLRNSNYIVFVLQREEISTLELTEEPEGWNEDDLKLVRNTKYHGIVTQFTGGLKFRKAAAAYIQETYSDEGLNGNLYLIKYQLKNNASYVIGDTFDKIKFTERYRGLADFNTLKSKDGAVEINFNSDQLEQLIKAHEGDDLGIERITDIDGDSISDIPLNHAILEGRDLNGQGEHVNFSTTEAGSQAFNIDRNKVVIPTQFITKGFDRHIEVTDALFDEDNSKGWQSAFFYDDIEDVVQVISKLEINADFSLRLTVEHDVGFVPKIAPYLAIFNFNGNGYDEVTTYPIGTTLYDNGELITFNGLIHSFGYEIPNTWAMAIQFEVTNFSSNQNGGLFKFVYQVNKYNITVIESTKFDSDGRIYKFAFVNQVASRIMEILSGDRFKFYSKDFGRDILSPASGHPTQYYDYDYAQDGKWGNIGLIHGFDVRTFSTSNPLYKSLTTSLKDLISSLQATFNIGVGVENSDRGQRLRFEHLEHYYRSDIVVKLPSQVSDVEREVEPNMFYSACEFGSIKGGDYENGLGLDEPNINSKFITPIRKTDKKYIKLSKVRSDETGMELLRRQPEYLDKTADRSGDDHIWYLDLKVNTDGLYEQLEWQDALESEPTGIFSPETYHNWRFTPKRSMLRHGFPLRTGIEQAKHVGTGSSSALIPTSSNSNVNLVQHPIGENEVIESAPQAASSLDRSPILPEKIKFTHPVNDELLDLIIGTTSVEINGEAEDVPNWYFKFQWINENEEFETGFLVSLSPTKGQFEFYKANENLIV